jgi:hypothetical protein
MQTSTVRNPSMKRDGLQIVIVFILIFVFLIGCSSDAIKTKIAPSPSATFQKLLVHTAISSPTKPRATNTPVKHVYPTRTPSLPPPPTPTLWYGTPLPSAQYQLVDWTPALAEKLIAELETYPDTLDFMERGMYGSLFSFAYRFASLAEAEAAYRFPGNEEKESWIWASAYNWLQSYQSNVGPIYSKLVVDALNQGKTSMADLKSWFEEKEPRLLLEIIPLPMIIGYRSSQIVYIQTDDEVGNVQGGTYFWLLEDHSDFSAYLLESDHDYGLLDFQTDISLEDLTGDGVQEAVVTHIDWGSFLTHSGSLGVFSLNRVPPEKLNFEPLPSDFEVGNWSPWEKNNQRIGFQIQIPVYIESGGCGMFGPTWNYRWNGSVFELVEILFPTQGEMEDEQHNLCVDYTIADYLPLILKRNIQQAYPILTQALDQYPYSKNGESFRGRTQASRDEVRYKVGLIMAKIGYFDQALEQWNLIPVDSEWHAIAQKALSAERSDNNFFALCLEVGNCYTYFQVEELIGYIPFGEINNIVDLFTQLGIPVEQSGVFDFDHDGNGEQWILFEENTGEYKFNYFFPDQNYIGVDRHFTSFYSPDVIGPVVITQNGENDAEYIYSISIGDKESQKVELRVGKANDIFPDSYKDAKTKLLTIEQEFFYSSGSLDEFHNRLSSLGFDNYSCDDYRNWWCDVKLKKIYLLALSYELKGDQVEAARLYYSLWSDYPDSPYALMARYKLTPSP